MSVEIKSHEKIREEFLQDLSDTVEEVADILDNLSKDYRKYSFRIEQIKGLFRAFVLFEKYD